MKPLCFLFFCLSIFTYSFSREEINEKNLLSPLRGNGMQFIENKGQIIDMNNSLRPDIYCVGEAAGTKVYLRKGGMSYVLSTETKKKEEINERLRKIDNTLFQRIDVDFLGSNINAAVLYSEKVEGYFNYLSGRFSKKITRVNAYNKVEYKNIYENINIIYHGNIKNGLKYDIIVNPGGNPDDIRIQYVGAEQLNLVDGKLNIKMGLGKVIEYMPKVYQNINGRIVTVKARYILEKTTIKFKIQNYNSSFPLIIDPWVTYYGGIDMDEGSALAVDASGNAIITGFTLSTDFPVSAGAFQTNIGGNYDALIIKFDEKGIHLWTTYYGGDQGDIGLGVAIDKSNNIVICGTTASTNLPISATAFQTTYSGAGSNFGYLAYEGDAFIAKFDAMGSFLWATYYGGSNNEIGSGIAIDASNNILVAGTTQSPDFSVSPGAFQTSYKDIISGSPYFFYMGDCFILKFDENGSRLWATYYGGSDADGGQDISTDASNNIVLTGHTTSQDFPVNPSAFQNTLAGSSDNFIAKFNPGGNPLWATYIGGTADDYTHEVAVDSYDNIVIIGFTGSADFPVSSGAYQSTLITDPFFPYNACLAKFDANGNRLWSTYFGTAPAIGYSCAIDWNNNIYIFGDWEDFDPGITYTCGYQKKFAEHYSEYPEDLFIAKFDLNGKHICDSYLGGPLEDDLDFGGEIACYKGFIYMAANSYGPYFPVTDSAFQTDFAGGDGDLVIAKICGSNCGDSATISNLKVSWGGNSFCAGSTVSFTNLLENANLCDTVELKYLWSFSGATPSSSTDINPSGITYPEGGIFPVKLSVIHPCGVDSVIQFITISSSVSNANILGDTTLCSGDSSLLIITGANSCTWNPGTGLSSVNSPTVTIMPPTTTTYTVNGIGEYGCPFNLFLTLSVDSLPSINISGPDSICYGVSANLIASGAKDYLWSTGATTSSVLVLPTITGTYHVYGITSNGCTGTDSIKISLHTPLYINADEDKSICVGQTIQLTSNATGSNNYGWNTGDQSKSINVSPMTTTSYTVTTLKGSCAAWDDITVFVNSLPIASAGGNITINPGQSISLNGTGGGKYLWYPATGLSCIICSNPTATPLQTTIYCLTVVDTNSCSDTACVTITIDYDCETIFVPNSFSPNKDGHNDEYIIKGSCIKEVLFMIYDRWGEIVFQTNDISIPWDGSYKGKMMNVGVYTYRLEATLYTSDKITKSGNITLVR